MCDANERWNATWRVPPIAEILQHVGQPVRKIFEGLYPEMENPRREELADAVLKDLTMRIRRGEGRLYDGVMETLTTLQSAYPLLLISNCRRAYLEAIVETYDLARFFEAIACNEDAPELGKPGLLKKLLAGRRGVMVGDRASDGEAAAFAGVPWIKCDYGYADDVPADAVIRSFPEVIPAIQPCVA